MTAELSVGEHLLGYCQRCGHHVVAHYRTDDGECQLCTCTHQPVCVQCGRPCDDHTDQELYGTPKGEPTLRGRLTDILLRPSILTEPPVLSMTTNGVHYCCIPLVILEEALSLPDTVEGPGAGGT